MSEREPNDVLDLSNEHRTAYLEHVVQLAESEPQPFDGAPFDGEELYRDADREREGRDSLPTLCAADIEPEPVHWFWSGYIPFGTMTLVEGAGGHGKSTLTAPLVAAVTAGIPFPDGSRCPEHGGVLILAAEDDEASTIVPRLLAVNADLNRVQIVDETALIETGLSFPDDCEKLRATIEKYGIRLVVIDPIFSYTGRKVDTNNDASARGMLTALQRVARETSTAIIVIRHFKKGTAGTATERGGGSVAFGNAARSVLQVWREFNETGEETGRYVLARAKGNLSAPPPSLVYTLESLSVQTASGTAVETSRTVWHGIVETTAEQLSAADRAAMLGASGGEGDNSKLAEAIEFLQEELRNGPVAAAVLKRQASEAGIAWRTIERAKQSLHIGSGRVGKGWGWQLPDTLETGASPSA